MPAEAGLAAKVESRVWIAGRTGFGTPHGKACGSPADVIEPRGESRAGGTAQTMAGSSHRRVLLTKERRFLVAPAGWGIPLTTRTCSKDGFGSISQATDPDANPATFAPTATYDSRLSAILSEPG